MTATDGTGGIPAGFERNLGDINGDGTGSGMAHPAPHLGNVVKIEHPAVSLVGDSSPSQTRVEVLTSNLLGQPTTRTGPNGDLTVYVRYPYNDPEGNGGATAPGLSAKQYGRIKEIHVDANPDDVLSLVGSDGDLVDFLPSGAIVPRPSSEGDYLDLVTRYEGGSGAAGSGCASCAYDGMGNSLAVTDPRGFTTRYDRNELGEIYRTISPQPYNFRVESYFDANRNVTRVDTEDLQPAFDSADPTSAFFAQFTPSGSGYTAHVPMQPGPGGSVRPGWFTNLFTFDLLDDKVEEDIDATGSTPANLVTKSLYDPNQNLIQIIKPEGNIVEHDYDERNLRIATRVGRDMGLAAPEPGAVTVTAYDANGNVLQVIGAASRGGATESATIEDAFRSGQTLTPAGDLVLNNTYDGFDRVIKALDPLGNYVDTGYGYSSDPFLDPDGRVIRSDSYQPGTLANVLLASVRMRFDEAGQQYEVEREVFVSVDVSLLSGRTITHNYDGCLQANNATNRSSATPQQIYPIPGTGPTSTYVLTRTIYDPGGRTVATLADNTGSTTIAYDGADRQTKVSDAMGNIVANQFDAAGNLVVSTRTEKCTITTPAVADETFPTAMFYDSLNRLVLQASQGADGTFVSNFLGLPVGGVSFAALSSWNLSTATLISCTGYDSRGNPVLSVDPKGNSSIAVFDGAGRTIQRQQHLRQAGQGQNPPVNNGTLLPGGGASVVTTMILDGNGRQTQLIDDRGDITLFEFDTLDREVKMTFHDGSTRTSVYDEDGDLITFTDENGSQFNNTFDALGRKTAVDIVVSTGTGQNVSTTTQSQSFQYDGLSRTTLALDSDQRLVNQGASGAVNAKVTLAYDSIGRLLEESQVYQGNTRNVTNTAFTSYPASQFTFPNPTTGSPRQIGNTYDLLYRRKLAHDETGDYDIASSQFFGPARLAEVVLGNGLICTWMNNARTNSAVQSPTPTNPAWGDQSSDRLGYDGAGRAITKRYLAGGISDGSAYNNPAALVGFSTEYDRAGNKFFERALHAENRSHLYEPFDLITNLPHGGYDSLDRLLQYQRGTLAGAGGGSGGNGGGSISSPISLPGADSLRTYVLDGLGNWRQTAFTPVVGSAQTQIRQHNGLNQITRIQGLTQTNLSYDGTPGSSNGNLKSDGTLTYAWDALNRLVQVNTSGGTLLAQYFYDALDRRIRKVVSNGGLSGDIPNGTTDCIYSGWRCVEDRDVNNSPTLQYVWGIYLDELLQIRTLVDVTTGSVGNQTTYAANNYYYPLQDLLYRTTATSDSSGSVVEAYDTDAYGNTLIFNQAGPGPNWWIGARRVSNALCQFIFTGQRFGAETGLYYYKRRYYSPVFGRFVSRDPIAADMNLYRYAKNRPLTDGDPTGLGYFDNWTGVDPNGHCCKKPIKMWQYWGYSSQQECACHILFMASLRPGGAIFSLGSAGFAQLKPALQKWIKLGNWSQVIATAAAGLFATLTAKWSCNADFCLNADIVFPICTLYEYHALGLSYLWTCTRVECHCPAGSVDWTNKGYGAPVPPPTWDLDKLLQEAEKDWPTKWF